MGGEQDCCLDGTVVSKEMWFGKRCGLERGIAKPLRLTWTTPTFGELALIHSALEANVILRQHLGPKAART